MSDSMITARMLVTEVRANDDFEIEYFDVGEGVAAVSWRRFPAMIVATVGDGNIVGIVGQVDWTAPHDPYVREVEWSEGVRLIRAWVTEGWCTPQW